MIHHYSTTGAFLTAKSKIGVNTMVVSWGYFGFNWYKPSILIEVRPQRYTKLILDEADSFTISVPFGTMTEQLKICGTQSGYNINKSEIVDFIPSITVQSPIVNGCDMYYECIIKSKGNSFKKEELNEELNNKCYSKGDHHYLYFGEIVNAYSKPTSTSNL